MSSFRRKRREKIEIKSDQSLEKFHNDGTIKLPYHVQPNKHTGGITFFPVLKKKCRFSTLMKQCRSTPLDFEKKFFPWCAQ